MKVNNRNNRSSGSSRMSDSSDEDDQRKAESASRMWAESQPGPSRQQPSRQGYCGYCRVLYSNLDEHLSSLRHLDSIRASSRGSSGISSASSSRTNLTLLERFLQDVLQHHPHRYNDPRPSHADLPQVSAPPLPSGVVCQSAKQQEEVSACSQSAERVTSRPMQEMPSARTADPGERETDPTESSHAKAPPSVHRKAHRKTDRRKKSDSSDSPPPPRGPGPRPCPASDTQPWHQWQRERREARKEDAFSSDHEDALDRTIEEVIQVCCYGISSIRGQQEEAESFHFSPPVSLDTQSDDWDSPVQVVLQQGDTVSHSPVQTGHAKGRDLSHLMDVQVNLEDQTYSCQLDSALRGEQWPGGGAGPEDEGFWNLPIEEVLPAPEHIPESFRGKTWAQVEQEDELRVDKLVRQFRRGRFVCYFDSESLARYGRRRQNKKGCGDSGAGSDAGVLPLIDQDEGDSVCIRARRRCFRMASRCQVVKVSHSTQTVQLVIPAVRQTEAPPPSVPPASQNAAERTPEAQSWRCLPPSYSSIITPLQPRTSLVYLLCSPAGPSSVCTPPLGSAPKRCRKKRRPLDLQGLKVKYKRLPVKFYDLGSNRILKNAPKGFLLRRGPTPPGPPPPCVRQLFRSLSPDLNMEREGVSGPSRGKPQRASDTYGSHFLLGVLGRRETGQAGKQDVARRRGRMPQAPPTPPLTRSERARGGRRTRPLPPKRRGRAQATPPQPRREGLRRTPALLTPPQPRPPSPHRGRGRRGRGCEKGRR